jgi:putative ABC transport system permease protein
VVAAGAVSSLPLFETRIDSDDTFRIEGRPPAPGLEPTAYQSAATPDYFRAMGIPLRRGRFFAPSDDADGAPVMIISETMARRFWPDQDPIGARVTIGLTRDPLTCEVVGVVGDVRHTGLDGEPRPEIFFPHLQDPFGSMTYVVRGSIPPDRLVPAVKREIRAVNPSQTFSVTTTMDELVSRSLGERRFSLLLLGTFGLLALILASVGLYGVISFTTALRTHEFGVRLALGAQPQQIVAMVVGEGMRLCLLGTVIGLFGAAITTRFAERLLFGVSATDPIAFAAMSLLLVGVGAAASYLPARRALKLDPMVAMRRE